VVIAVRAESIAQSPPRTHCGDLADPPSALTPLCHQPHWVVWRWVKDRNGRWTKPPYRADHPDQFATNNDNRTWSTFRMAVSAVLAGHAHGIGFVITNTNIGAVDLDGCRDPQTGQIAGWAQEILNLAPTSYHETTVSGTGLRIIGTTEGAPVHRRFSIRNGYDHAGVEVYRNCVRYITVSGAQLGTCTALPNIDACIDAIVRQHDRPEPAEPDNTRKSPDSKAADIEDLIRSGVERPFRSEAFGRVVWSLAGRGWTVDQIYQELASYPTGIAAKYGIGQRLRREVERSYHKRRLQNPSKATSETPEWPDVNKKGQPTRTYRNAREAIRALGVICSYDEFHDRMIVGGHPINQWAGELSDAVSVILRQAIIDRFGFDPGKDNIADAATELCLEGRFNPILDYLDELDWDENLRLEKWLTTYLGAEDTPLNRAIGRLTLIAAVRRVRQPGCKFDFIPTLEGAEGTMKSTSIVTLAGMENFSDQTILTQSDKEQQELVRGVWLYEIADLAGMRRADVEKIKAFASRTHDRARPAYGRRRVDAPRHCIFIATTNEDEYLQSQTGNRRFWPVKTGTIDIESLRRDRDQLWAEAAEAETEGEPLVLPKDQWGEASAAQDARRMHDPWDDILSGVPGRIYLNEVGADEERISSEELLKVLEVPPGKVQNVDALRLKRVMLRLGWSGPKKFRFGEATKRGYFREVSETAGTTGTGGTVEHDF
jgi:hypothetical protein